MAEGPDNLVLQHLRAIRETQDNHTDRLLEITQRVGNLEVRYHISGCSSLICRFASIGSMPVSNGSSGASVDRSVRQR